MKKHNYLFLILLPFLAGVFLHFSQDDEYYSAYKPVLMERADMEARVGMLPPRNLVDPVKIYLKDQYVLITERYKGIHVIDNSNPEAPAALGFLRVDGCLDVAVKDHVLYCDNAVDLVAIDMSKGFEAIEVVSRVKDAFPEPLPPDGKTPMYVYSEKRPQGMIIINWIPR